ncbi:MAG: hypothetical protein AMJ62_03305 [Myxococcales bacterium SG8_38]|nr:MAG: hypothetical protein AMJ62_03305 [Myxococcales bacterium SG8_38]
MGSGDFVALGPSAPVADGSDAGRATLDGRVYDERGRPVQGATISLAGSGFWPARAVQTDAEGRFHWPDIPSGIYELRASKGQWVAPALQGLILDPGTQRTFALRLARGWTLAGRVIDRLDGRPVRHARVTLVAGLLGLHTRRVETDDRGGFELSGIVQDGHSLYVEAERYVSAGPLRYAEQDSPVTVELDPAATIEGRVVDERGGPIDGAWVSAFSDEQRPQTAAATVGADSLGVTLGPVPPISAAGAGARAMAARVTVRSDGSFSISNLPAGSYTIAANHDDYAPAESALVRVGPGAMVPGVEITMRRGAEVAGRVVDERGRGLEGIPVELRAEGERFARTSITSSGGSFSFRGVRGQVSLTARPYELLPVRETLTIDDEGLVTVELPLGSTLYTLRGRVVDEAGFGVGGALVTVSSNNPQTPVRRSTKSDADGTFSVAALPEPPFTLRAEHPTFSPARLAEIDRIDDVQVVMSAGITFLGRVLDDWTSEGLQNVRISLEGPVHADTKTRPDGTFVFDQVPTGTYEVSFAHPEYEAQARRVVIEPPRYVDRPQTLETIRLEPGGTIVGEILDAYNQPVASAEVAWGEPPRWHRAALTDARGKFQLRGVPAGYVWLTARHPEGGEGSSLESVTVRPKETSSGVFVRLPESVRR